MDTFGAFSRQLRPRISRHRKREKGEAMRVGMGVFVRLVVWVNTFRRAENPSALESGFLRPRYPGYHEFQSFAGAKLHTLVFEGGPVRSFLDQVNRAYRESRAERG